MTLNYRWNLEVLLSMMIKRKKKIIWRWIESNEEVFGNDWGFEKFFRVICGFFEVWNSFEEAMILNWKKMVNLTFFGWSSHESFLKVHLRHQWDSFWCWIVFFVELLWNWLRNCWRIFESVKDGKSFEFLVLVVF